MAFYDDLISHALSSLSGEKKPLSPLPQAETLDTQKKLTDKSWETYTKTHPAGFSYQKAIQGAIDNLNPFSHTGASAGYADRERVVPNDASDFERQAAPILKKYQVPLSVGFGQWAQEGRGKTLDPTNPYNINAMDSNPNAAFHYNSPIEGTEAYAKFVTGQGDSYASPQVKEHFKQAHEQYLKTGDAKQYLKDIHTHYASDPNYVDNIVNTPEFRRYQ